MEPEENANPQAALRPLDNVAAVLAALRSAALPPEEARGAIMQVAAAVESSLRRLLRDLPEASMQVRLRALAPDELRADEALAELRQHDRVSIELAAAVHDLFELRRRLREGAAPGGDDASLAYRVAERLRSEALQPRHDRTVPAGEAPALDETLVQPPPPPGAAGGFPRLRRGWWAAGGLALLLLIGLGVWAALPRDRGELEQGIALFRSGAYADAASRFWRYAEEHPDDPTPHLYLARIHRRMRRPDLAAPALRKALQLAPDDADVHEELGFLLLDTGHAERAVPRFRAALDLDPESKQAWLGLVRSLRAAGQPDAAARVLRSAPAEVRQLFDAASPR